MKGRVTSSWCVAVLLSFGVSAVAAADSDLRLVEAVKNKDIEAARSLLKQHVDVNAPLGDGATALAWAAHWDDLETAELLISAGANPNAADDLGVVPLWEACTNRNAGMVERLLKAGAKPDAALVTGETSLMMCSRTGSVEGVQLLLGAGANVNAKENRKWQTPLMWAVSQRHPDVAKVLIERGADVHARTRHVVLPAAKSGGYGTGDRADDKYEGDFREVSKGGFTPLLFAAQQGDLESVRILLAAGADVNEATPEGSSALIRASANGRLAVAKFLLEKGANPNAADENGFTSLHYALLKGLSALRYEMERHFIRFLARPNMPELVKTLLEHGANPNLQIARVPEMAWSVDGPSVIGATPLILAAETADVGIMRALTAAGANPNLAIVNRKQGIVTPLMVAAGMYRYLNVVDGLGVRAIEMDGSPLEAVKVVLEAGADVKATNDLGLTALHVAAAYGENEIIQILVEKGAIVDAKDSHGQTPWNIAANVAPSGSKELFLRGLERNKNKTTAALLVKLGAKPGALPEERSGAESAKPPAER